MEKLKLKIKYIILIILKPFLETDFIFRLFLKNKVCVFVFHDVSDTPTKFSELNGLNVPPVNFKKQIGLIKKYFSIISIDELLDFKDKKTRKGTYALITFDDGYRSLFDFVFPYLEAEKVPAILFVNGEIYNDGLLTSGLIDYLIKHDEKFEEFCLKKFKKFYPAIFTDLHPDDLNAYLNDNLKVKKIWKTITEYCSENLKISHLEKFKNSDFIKYGNHLYHHYNAVLLKENELSEEIKKNERILSKYKNYRKVFSATFGIYNETLGEAVIKQGFKAVFGENNGINKLPAGYSLKRITISPGVITDRGFIFEINKRILKSILF